MKESTVSKEYIGQRVKEIISDNLTSDFPLCDPRDLNLKLDYKST
jgi:hypothetical protein